MILILDMIKKFIVIKNFSGNTHASLSLLSIYCYIINLSYVIFKGFRLKNRKIEHVLLQTKIKLLFIICHFHPPKESSEDFCAFLFVLVGIPVCPEYPELYDCIPGAIMVEIFADPARKLPDKEPLLG